MSLDGPIIKLKLWYMIPDLEKKCPFMNWTIRLIGNQIIKYKYV
jgi:hypothetical protein